MESERGPSDKERSLHFPLRLSGRHTAAQSSSPSSSSSWVESLHSDVCLNAPEVCVAVVCRWRCCSTTTDGCRKHLDCTERLHMRAALDLLVVTSSILGVSVASSSQCCQSQSWFPLCSACRERFLSAPPVFRQTRRVCSFFCRDSTLSPKASAAGRCECR